MRSDRLIMPSANLNVEGRQSCAHSRRSVLRQCRIIIDMGVVTLNHALAHSTPLAQRLLLIIKSDLEKPSQDNVRGKKGNAGATRAWIKGPCGEETACK